MLKLPYITEEIVEDYRDTNLIGWSNRYRKYSWTQLAVDFACLLQWEIMKDDYDAPKYLTVKQLKDVLEQIPEDYIILPNRVGNLAVYKGGNLEKAEFAGFVSFICDGEYESYE